MPFRLPPLPYAADALQPHMSAETLQLHHGKHHQTYVDTVNKLIEGTPHEKQSLEEIILASDGKLFNNAAQVWNHSFFWQCMKPDGGGQPSGSFAGEIAGAFGSVEKFVAEFSAAAVGQFGSGWAWLVSEQGKMKVIATANADLPMKHGQKALLTLDVWEHAYYVDHRNQRPKFVETFFAKLINWDFAERNLTA